MDLCAITARFADCGAWFPNVEEVVGASCVCELSLLPSELKFVHPLLPFALLATMGYTLFQVIAIFMKAFDLKKSTLPLALGAIVPSLASVAITRAFFAIITGEVVAPFFFVSFEIVHLDSIRTLAYLVLLGVSYLALYLVEDAYYGMLIRNTDPVDACLETERVLTGKTAFVTGGTAGSGLFIAKRLASRGAHVFVSSIDSATMVADALNQISLAADEAALGGSVEFLPGLDLADVPAVSEWVETTMDSALNGRVKHKKLDIIIANAGVIPKTASLTPLGMDPALNVNYLGHVGVVAACRVHMAEHCRVVLVSSEAHRFSDDIISKCTARSLKKVVFNQASGLSYPRSKLCVTTVAQKLNRMWSEETQAGVPSVSVFSAHPGSMPTDIYAASTPKCILGAFNWATRRLLRSAESGAEVALNIVLHPEVSELVGGGYYVAHDANKIHAVAPRAITTSHEAQDALWNATSMIYDEVCAMNDSMSESEEAYSSESEEEEE